MAFQFCVLGSGSSGNSVAFWDSETLFLVDAGFTCKATAGRLGKAGLDIKNLNAILISHEHVDHIGGTKVIQKKHSPRLLTTRPVHEWMDARFGMTTEPSLTPGRQLCLGDFTVTPFEVCHDASQTVGFAVQQNGSKVTIATDLGHVSPGITDYFRDADAIILESNHDVRMLNEGPYPAFLKKRILGKHGHLSNVQSAEMLIQVIGSRTKHVTLAHLSQENNRPEIAQEESERAVRELAVCKPEIQPASQFDIGNIIKIG